MQEAARRAFETVVEKALSAGVIDRYIPLSGVRNDVLGRKHFGQTIPSMRDHRGVPMFGWIVGIESAKTDYVVHFDSDILLYQARDKDWISDGIEVLKADERAMFVAPMPGPPHREGKLLDQATPPIVDAQGNWRFRTFSSRRFLVDRTKLNALLPIPLCYVSKKRHFLMKLGVGEALHNWEYCMGMALARSAYDRVHLRSSQAWTIHCPSHDAQWQTLLPSIISRVEKGEFPGEQAGLYDLQLPAWQ